MRLSKHAKDRLKERFDINEEELSLVGNMFNQKKEFKLIQKDLDREIREIKYKGVPIQCVIKDARIVTCHWDTFVEDTDISVFNRLTEENAYLRGEIAYYEKKLKKKDKIMTKLGTYPLIYVIKYIYNLRKNWEKD